MLENPIWPGGEELIEEYITNVSERYMELDWFTIDRMMGWFGNYPCSNLEASDMNVNWELNVIKIPTGGFLNVIIDRASFPIGFAIKPGTFPWKYIPNGLFFGLERNSKPQ